MNVPSRRRPAAEMPRESPVAAFVRERRAALGAVAVVAAAVVGGWLLWDRYGDEVRDRPDGLLFPEGVELRGVAPWVHADIRAEALRDASLDGGVPLDDPALVEALRRAFARHPWVREVVGVVPRAPAAAVVEIRCREPVAKVHLGKDRGWYAIDAAGVVLPSEDFTRETVAAYPTIKNVQSTPLGTAGTPWGDRLVVEGASVAATIGPDWPRLGMDDLVPFATPNGIGWDLVGDGRTIRFGSAPGRERAGEPPAAVKVARLRELVERGAGDAAIDLTEPPGGELEPVTGADPAPTPARP